MDPFDDLAEEYVARGAVLGRMIRSRGLKVEGKFICFRLPEALAVKLPLTRVEELVADGRERFDRGDGRPMREWVLLPDAEASVWPSLLDEAWDFRRSQLDES